VAPGKRRHGGTRSGGQAPQLKRSGGRPPSCLATRVKMRSRRHFAALAGWLAVPILRVKPDLSRRVGGQALQLKRSASHFAHYPTPPLCLTTLNSRLPPPHHLIAPPCITSRPSSAAEEKRRQGDAGGTAGKCLIPEERLVLQQQRGRSRGPRRGTVEMLAWKRARGG
jgi:hypothetical protein